MKNVGSNSTHHHHHNAPPPHQQLSSTLTQHRPVGNKNQDPVNLNVLESLELEYSLLSDFDAVSSLTNKNYQRQSATTKPSRLLNSDTMTQIRMSDAYLSSTMREMISVQKPIPLRAPITAPNTPEQMRRALRDKKEKMEYNQMMMRSLNDKDGRPLSYHGRSGSLSNCLDHAPPPPVNKRHIVSSGGRNRKESLLLNRRSMPTPYLENKLKDKLDITDLDTNLPRIDLDAIETHLRQAREEERKRRSDREEIRRRLALEADSGNDDKPRKHGLQSRLQTSMNLQICFMNETASDSESPSSDNESQQQQKVQQQRERVQSLPCLNKAPSLDKGENPASSKAPGNEDFLTKQAKIQAEARHALAQAKDVARLQLCREREARAQSPITEMVRNSLQKVGVGWPPDRRRVSRQLLTDMNVAQLQVIVNDLHSHIEKLNETLVSMLLERDDLHMEQDSMLVDIEDLTRYLAAKYNSPHQSMPLIPSRNMISKGEQQGKPKH